MTQLAEVQRMQIAISSAHEYRPDVDGLRAIAVSAVIANHFDSKLLPGGFLGVDMFFVISGFVITTSLAKQFDGSIRTFLPGFYSRRIKRLLPALVVCVAVTSLLGALFISPEAQRSSMEGGIFALFGLSNIYFFRESANYFGSSAQFNLFTHTWSLGVEEQFYVVFPVLLWICGSALGRRRGGQLLLAVLGLLAILSFSSYLRLSETTPNGAYFLLPSRLWELSIGCMAALVGWHPRSGVGGRLEKASWLACVLLAIVLLAPADQQLYTTPAIVIGTAVLIMTLRPGTLVHRLLTQKHVLLVGLMSYSLYLWHWTVLSISRWTIGVSWWSAPVQIGFILVLAGTSYVFVERPLRRAEWAASKLVTIGFGMLAAVCSAGVVLVLQSGLGGRLYTGSPLQMAARGVASLADNKWRAGKLQWPAGDCILASNNDVGKRISADVCTLGEPIRSKPHFLVIGDSFSTAEFEMYSVLSENGLGSVTATSSWGAAPVPEMSTDNMWAKASAYYWGDVVPTLMSRLDNGDFLIMINDVNSGNVGPLRSGLSRLAEVLRQKGVQIIFQSQNPLIREAQCTPDKAKRQWFMGPETNCIYFTKAYSIEHRRPLQGMLEDLQSNDPNFHVLDLFPVLCPEDVCRFYNTQGVILYRDEFSHLSIEANYLARPLLLAVVNKAIKASNGISLGAKARGEAGSR